MQSGNLMEVMKYQVIQAAKFTVLKEVLGISVFSDADSSLGAHLISHFPRKVTWIWFTTGSKRKKNQLITVGQLWFGALKEKQNLSS